MRQYISILLTVAALAGCSKDSPTNPSQRGGRPEVKSPDRDKAAKDSWAQFVSRAKGNIDRAIRDSKGKVAADHVEIDLVSDDVKKSSSVKHPYEGTARVKAVHASSTIRTHYDYTLRFGYEDGRWVFLGGQEVNDSGSYELKTLRFVYLKMMFAP